MTAAVYLENIYFPTDDGEIHQIISDAKSTGNIGHIFYNPQKLAGIINPLISDKVRTHGEEVKRFSGRELRQVTLTIKNYRDFNGRSFVLSMALAERMVSYLSPLKATAARKACIVASGNLGDNFEVLPIEGLARKLDAVLSFCAGDDIAEKLLILPEGAQDDEAFIERAAKLKKAGWNPRFVKNFFDLADLWDKLGSSNAKETQSENTLDGKDPNNGKPLFDSRLLRGVALGFLLFCAALVVTFVDFHPIAADNEDFRANNDVVASLVQEKDMPSDPVDAQFKIALWSVKPAGVLGAELAPGHLFTSKDEVAVVIDPTNYDGLFGVQLSDGTELFSDGGRRIVTRHLIENIAPDWSLLATIALCGETAGSCFRYGAERVISGLREFSISEENPSVQLEVKISHP